MSGTDIFELALNFTLKAEGGYVNDPDDPGGATNKGIIQSEYNKYRTSKKLPLISVKEITDDEVKEIYYNDYWIKAKCNLMPNRLAVAHFDTAVNVGVNQANKFLQRSLKVKDDGIIGNITIEALNKITNTYHIVYIYIDQRKIFYINLVKNKKILIKFLKGWTNRINNLNQFLASIV